MKKYDLDKCDCYNHNTTNWNYDGYKYDQSSTTTEFYGVCDECGTEIVKRITESETIEEL